MSGSQILSSLKVKAIEKIEALQKFNKLYTIPMEMVTRDINRMQTLPEVIEFISLTKLDIDMTNPREDFAAEQRAAATPRQEASIRAGRASGAQACSSVRAAVPAVAGTAATAVAAACRGSEGPRGGHRPCRKCCPPRAACRSGTAAAHPWRPAVVAARAEMGALSAAAEAVLQGSAGRARRLRHCRRCAPRPDRAAAAEVRAWSRAGARRRPLSTTAQARRPCLSHLAGSPAAACRSLCS
jgi:hypothetical protein